MLSLLFYYVTRYWELPVKSECCKTGLSAACCSAVGHLDRVYDVRIFIRVREKSDSFFLPLYRPVLFSF